MKYIMMGTSSNFGNMFSVAGASIFLPFLPMLPIQILLNNLLYDFSELTIPTDNVDQEYLSTPKRWDISFIRRFMITLGPISSIFDFLTFFIMWFVFHASAPLFQTAWFLESLASQSLVVFVIRTRETPFYKSRPSKFLLISTLGVVAFALILPLTPIGRLFKFEVPPFTFFIILAGLLIVYLALVDLVKRWFYRHYSYGLEVISKPNNDIYT
jgi:Mg2+-importing ATPase